MENKTQTPKENASPAKADEAPTPTNVGFGEEMDTRPMIDSSGLLLVIGAPDPVFRANGARRDPLDLDCSLKTDPGTAINHMRKPRLPSRRTQHLAEFGLGKLIELEIFR